MNVFTVDLTAKTKFIACKLSMEEIESEFRAIAQTGLEEILILTGESRHQSNLDYIGQASRIGKRIFYYHRSG